MTDIVADRPHLFLGSRLRRLGERLQAEAAQVSDWAGVEVPAGLHAVLATLEQAGPQPVSALARSLGVSQPAMTKSIGRLIEAGLVSAARGTGDRRQSLVGLTAKGEAALARGRQVVWPLVEAAAQEVTTGLTGSLLEQIAELDRRLAAVPLSKRALDAARVELRPATEQELPAVVALLSRAYRGTGAAASWCSETGFIEGDRTSEALLRQELRDRPAGTLLVWELLGAIQGTVWLEPEDERTWYLGSLAVNPQIQGAQLGRRLLSAAENWVRGRGGNRVRMTVVNVRDSLLAWYERRGYRPTGATEPFPYEDARFGRPTRPDLCFLVLAKQI